MDDNEMNDAEFEKFIETLKKESCRKVYFTKSGELDGSLMVYKDDFGLSSGSKQAEEFLTCMDKAMSSSRKKGTIQDLDVD